MCFLPEEIGNLTHLEVFNLEGNKLKKLPKSFDMLKRLKSLNLKNNKFQQIPMVLCNVISLRNLNLCNNKKLKVLPKEFSNLLNLENLEIDDMDYPSSDICSEGTQSILKFLCEESGKSYIPPTGNNSLHQEDCVQNEDSNFSLPIESPWNDSNLSASYHQYQRIKEQRRLDLLQMEEALKDDQELQARFAADASVRRQKLLEDVTQEQERLEDEILMLQNKKDKERQILLAVLSNIEDHSAKLIDQIMCLNEKNKRQDLLEVLEQDRLEAEEMYLVKQEELEELRKKDILDAMKDMLQAEERQRQYEAGKLAITRKLQNSVSDTDLKLLDVLCGREQDQQVLIKKLLEEEAFQKEAFEALQIQKDKRHNEISYQIKLIEEELSKLTMAEVKKKDLKVNVEVNVLAERRAALAQLLTDLLEAKEEREKELQNRLLEMERKRLDEVKDFWFIQYQKLLDRKPAELIDAELKMDPLVRAVVIDAGASDYLTFFAKKAVTWPQLLAMTVKDLKKIGILDEEVCLAILNKAREYFLSSKLGIEGERWIPETPKIVRAPETPENIPSPTAPSLSGESEGSEEIIEATSEEDIHPSAPPLSPDSEVKLFCQTECVVCLEQQSTAVFLPCGHVCCCWNCSSALDSCPMCRMSIQSKFSVTFC